jgi:hypothetical protein
LHIARGAALEFLLHFPRAIRIGGWKCARFALLVLHLSTHCEIATTHALDARHEFNLFLLLCCWLQVRKQRKGKKFQPNPMTTGKPSNKQQQKKFQTSSMTTGKSSNKTSIKKAIRINKASSFPPWRTDVCVLFER